MKIKLNQAQKKQLNRFMRAKSCYDMSNNLEVINWVNQVSEQNFNDDPDARIELWVELEEKWYINNGYEPLKEDSGYVISWRRV